MDGSESEASSDVSFDIVLMGHGKKLGIKAPPVEFLQAFDTDLFNSLYFGDHMAPFRFLMRSLRNASDHDRTLSITSLLIGQSCKVLVAVSGKEVSDSSVKVSDRAISFITGSLPREMVAISGSPWTVVQMKHVTTSDN